MNKIIQNIKNSKCVLIITCLNEDVDNVITHYSYIKGYLLAKGLLKNNYTPFFLTDRDNSVIYKQQYYFINHMLLTPQLLSYFEYAFFVLHNKDVIVELIEKTCILQNLIHAKKINSNLKIIDKTCVYPIIFDRYTDSYNFFDKVFMQTKYVILPKYITKKITHTDKQYTVESITDYCNKNGIINKFDYSQLTFDNYFDIPRENSINICLNKTKTNLLYMGRLNTDNGMNVMFLIKLMKKLGEQYHLYVIPGSFRLPNIKMYQKKRSCIKENYDEIKTFFEKYELDYDITLVPQIWRQKEFIEENTDYKKCNITVLPLYPYGKHFEVVKQFDIGLGFSNYKGCNTYVSSVKLYDYMYCGLNIVTEEGWNNSHFVSKYNFGIVLSNNSTIDEYADGIIEINNKKFVPDYSQFISDNNNFKRVSDLLSKINDT